MVAQLTEALREFRRRDNREWPIERHGYRTPCQARSDSCGPEKDLDVDPRCRKVGRVLARGITLVGIGLLDMGIAMSEKPPPPASR